MGRNYRDTLLQDIRSSETSHKSNARFAGTASSTERRHGEYCKADKNCTYYFLYVYVVFLACYLPISCVQLTKISGETALLSNLCYFTLTLVYLNSSLNPLIYCWKMRYIRQTVMEMLRNILAIGQH